MHRALKILACVALCLVTAGCESAAKSTSGQKLDDLTTRASLTVDRAQRDYPRTATYFENSAGYVVFPEVGKGGFIVGGSHGIGAVYERRAVLGDAVIGTADVSAGSIGLQIGGQTFSEIIFFEDDIALRRFKESKLELAANATAVAAAAGASAQAEYDNGVAIFIFNEKGLMGELSVGGQKFDYHALDR